MNHNGWIDRFENDEKADLPYERDRSGYNVYGGVYLWPDVRVIAGLQRIRQITDDRRNRAAYLLATVDRDIAKWGRIRLFQDIRKVEDDIRDDLFQWLQPPDTRGGMRLVTDILPARNTWISTTWIGVDYTRIPGLELQNKFKWQLYYQLDDDVELALRDVRGRAVFLGLINKAEYRLSWRGVTLVPRWKSELRHQQEVRKSVQKRREWSQLFMLLLRFPVFRSSFVESGVEYEIFEQLRDPTPPGGQDSFTGLVLTTQLSNLSEYQGYRLTTVLGFEVARRRFEYDEKQIRTRGFVTVYAGVQ